MNKKKSNELLLILGRWTSRIGNIIFDYANSRLLVDLFTSNPIILAIYQASEKVALLIFNLIGGAVSDGGNKKRILIVTDFISVFICFVAAMFVDSKAVAVALIIANIFLAIVTSFNSPTYKSIVRELIQEKRINKFNSISNAGIEVIMVVGPTIGLLLVNIIGIKGALIFNALTFFVSGISEMLLVAIEQYVDIQTIKNDSLLKRIIDGFKYLVNDKKILWLIIISSLVNFFLAGYNLLVPYTNLMYKEVIQNFYSKVLVTEAIGGIIGSIINSKLATDVHKSIKKIKIFLFMISFFLFIIPIVSINKNWIVCLLPFFLCSCVMTIFNIQFMSYIQINVEHEYLGRVFSVINAMASILMPLGSIFFSFIVRTTDIRSFYFVAFGVFFIAIVNLFICKNKE